MNPPQQPGQHGKKGEAETTAYENLSKNVIDLGSRLRVLEDQYSNLRNRGQLADQSIITSEKDIREDLKSLSHDILELKKTLNELSEKINIVGSELSNTVKEHEFRVVEKYIDLWNPSRFVTKEELKKRIEEAKK